MNKPPVQRQYSQLPEPYALLGCLVLIALLSAAWPNVSQPEFLVRIGVYGALVTAACLHSWFLARRLLWAGSLQAIGITGVWLGALAAAISWLEWESATPLFGVLAFLQIVECSFITNHVTLRVTHAVSFAVMLLSSARLPLMGGGAAWVAFAAISMFLLAYDRTARKAGPSGYNRGESRRFLQRLACVSLVAILAGGLFLLTPLLKWPDINATKKITAGKTGPIRALPPGDPLGVGGSTDTPSASNGPIQIMRVSTEPRVGGPLYLRGEVFDAFDGEGWSRSERSEQALDVVPGRWVELPFANSVTPASTSLLRQSVTMLVNMQGTVFTACRANGVRFPDGGPSRVIAAAADRTLRVDGSLADQSRYEINGFQDVFSDTGFVGVSNNRSADVTDEDLKVPAGISSRVREIAAEEAARYDTPYQRAVGIERYLRRNFTYSLAHDVHGPQVVNDFMLRTRRGHCALFASSMVVMARSVGLPARYVTGFVASEREGGGFVVRGADAHAWVEVYVDGAGWIAFDPTSGRVDPADTATRSRLRNGQPANAARPSGAQPGGGLYGRDQRSLDGSDGTGGSGNRSGNDIARNDDRTGAGGGEVVPGGGGAAGGADGVAGGNAGGGTVNGGDLGAPGQQGNAGTTTGTTAGTTPHGSGDGPGGTNGPDATASQGGGGAKPSNVVPPGGGTSLPQNVNANPSGTKSPSSTTKSPVDSSKPSIAKSEQKKPDPPPDPKKMESDWRLIVGILIGAGIIGLIALLFWKAAVQPLADRQLVRRAMPARVADDPDPRRFIVQLYHQMVDGLARLGFARGPSTTPLEYAAEVGRRRENIAGPVSELTELFHNARYWDNPVTHEDAGLARSAWERITKSVGRAKPEGDSEES